MSTHVNVNTLDFSFRNYFVKITLLSKLCNVIHPFISGLCGGLESILAVIKGTSGTSWTGCHGARRGNRTNSYFIHSVGGHTGTRRRRKHRKGPPGWWFQTLHPLSVLEKIIPFSPALGLFLRKVRSYWLLDWPKEILPLFSAALVKG